MLSNIGSDVREPSFDMRILGIDRLSDQLENVDIGLRWSIPETWK